MMAARDLMNDLLSGFGLLTRIPVPPVTPRPLAAWSWPLVGLVTGGASALAGTGAMALGLPAGAAGLLALAAPILLTGALHEDGLADCADGFWGGRDRARRLEIMKDSRIGSYGVLALVLVLALKASALAPLIAAHPLAIPVAAILSRVPMVAIMAQLTNARGSGLSHLTGAPPAPALAGALALGLAAALSLGTPGLAMALAAGLAGLAIALIARAKIGGQTGDVLGASQALAETAALLTALALVE